MNKIVASLWLVLGVLSATTAIARDYSGEIRSLQRSCNNQRGSLLYDRNGAPACDQIDQLIKLQRLEIEAQVARETKQPMPSHTDININQTVEHRGKRVWSSALGRYCYENQWGHLNCQR